MYQARSGNLWYFGCKMEEREKTNGRIPIADLFRDNYRELLGKEMARISEGRQSAVVSFDRRSEEAEKRCRKIALGSLLKQHEDYFPLWVVESLSFPGRYFLVRHLGEVGEEDLFYDTERGWALSLAKVVSRWIMPPQVEWGIQLDENLQKGILATLEKKVLSNEKSPPGITAPPGFYVFRFGAAGWKTEVWQETLVIKTTSYGQALQDLAGFMGKRDVASGWASFYDVEVCQPDREQGWQKVIIGSLSIERSHPKDIWDIGLKLKEGGK